MRVSKYFLQVRNKGRRGFVELGHFDKNFVKNTRIKSSARKYVRKKAPQDIC